MPIRWHPSHSLLATRMAVEIVTASDPEAESRIRTKMLHDRFRANFFVRTQPYPKPNYPNQLKFIKNRSKTICPVEKDKCIEFYLIRGFFKM